MSLFAELKRRNVVRVGVAYVVASWLLVQVGDIARESFDAPDWVMKMLLTALVAGLPIVLFFAWAFELTPDGIKREKDVDRSASISGETGKKLDYITIALLLGVVALVTVDRYLPDPAPAIPVQASSGVSEARPQATGVAQNSIAVLPFVNMSNDPDQAYFSDGISEELLNLLVRVDGLAVASRTSAFAYKGSNTAIPQIARELKVANILEGSVRKAGNRVRITAQLIDTTNDRHLWSDSFDRDLDDIFEVQDEIANAIVTALKSQLGLDLNEAAVSVTADTGNMNAYDLYLRGRELILARQELPTAIEVLEQAVTLDPGFTRAWSALATAAYLVPSWISQSVEGAKTYLDKAYQANERALALDPDHAQAWAIKSMLGQHQDGGPDYAAEIGYLDRALALDPKNATAWLWRGIKYTELGYQQQALTDMQRCLEINSAYQNCRRHLAMVLWLLGDIEAAVEQFTEGARNGFTGNNTVFVPLFISNGNLLAGILSAHYMKAEYPGFPMEEWIDALEHPDQDHSHYVLMARDWLASAERVPIGAREQLMLAFGGYEHIQINPFYVQSWLWHPSFPEFRRSPHFQRLIQTLNLPEYWEEHGLPPGCQKLREDYVCD